MNAIGYTRVSTDDQADHGASLTGQHTMIREECERRGWTLRTVHQDALSGKNTARPGLTAALEQLEPGSLLVVAKLDRLTRSVADLARLLETSKAGGWHLVALDFGLDMSTPQGELVANVLMSVAQWERRIIGQRTREGLAIKRAQGVRVGRPVSIDPAVAALARELVEADWKAYQVAEFFNRMGLPTPRGGRVWRHSSLTAVLQ